MPRSAQSQVGVIVTFFRKSDLPVAELVLDLCKDAVRERQQKSTKAKARVQISAATPTAVAAPAKVVKARKPKRAYKRKPKNQPLPLGDTQADKYETVEQPEFAEA